MATKPNTAIAKATTAKAPAAKPAAAKTSAASAPAPVKSAAAKPAASATKPVKQTTLSAEERWRMVAEAAFFIAEKRGFQGGDPAHDWIQAEQQIAAILGKV